MFPTIHELRTIIKLIKPPKGEKLAERLEDFYGEQAENYDAFRKKLLPGRETLMQLLTPYAKGVWVDFGCGTGSNLELFSLETLKKFKKIYLVDLSPSLLAQAAERVKKLGLANVELIEQDVCTFAPSEKVDLVTFSYSLTMIPHWFKAVKQAMGILKNKGTIGVVDFYVSEKFPATNLEYHSGWTRHFWRVWFSWDNVFLSSDHLPFLRDHFTQLVLQEGRSGLPFLPVGKVPFYIFVGSKSAN